MKTVALIYASPRSLGALCASVVNGFRCGPHSKETGSPQRHRGHRGFEIIGTVLAVFFSFALFGGTEIPVVTDIVLNEPPNERWSVALGSDGDGYLAVW